MIRYSFASLFAAVVVALLWAAPAKATVPTTLPQNQHWVLALTWHPAFCETVAFERPECQAPLHPKDKAPEHIVLHGLWPEGDTYCGVADDVVALDKAGKWSELDAVVLPDAVGQALDAVMPGRQSFLDRHEWVKHGTCSGLDPSSYFELAMTLVQQARTKAFSRAVYRAAGKSVSMRKLCSGVSNSLGKWGSQAFWLKTGKINDRPALIEMRIRLRAGADGRMDVLPMDVVPKAEMACEGPDLHIDKPGR